MNIFDNTRKLSIPKIYQCLSNSIKPLTTSASSLKISDHKCKNTQKTSFLKCFSSTKHGGRNETTSYSKSQIDCNNQEKKLPSKSRMQYRFNPDTEEALNHQINSEFNAFYHYLSMAAYFGRVDVALPGCESYFIQMQNEEYDHAMKFLDYIKIRGGNVNLCPINSPIEQDWRSPLHAFQTSLDLEIAVTDSLVALYAVAEKQGDLSTSDFIVENFIQEQMNSINKFARFVTILTNIGDQGLGQFIFDKDLMENHVSEEFNVLRKPDHHLKKK